MIRRVLDDPAVWALAVLAVALWCAGQALVGEPGLPSESLPPPAYVVAPAVTGVTVVNPPTGGTSAAADPSVRAPRSGAPVTSSQGWP